MKFETNIYIIKGRIPESDIMPKRKRLINKIFKKKQVKKCYFCPVDDYEALHVHRIVYGEHDGVYSDYNTLVVCANCHSRIHSGKIVIDRKYLRSNGKWVLHYWIDGEEKWD